MGAKEKEKRSETSRERENEKSGRDIPATLEDDDDDDDDSNKEESARSGRSGSSLRPPSGNSAGGGTTPTFIPSSAAKGLVAIPETEELSLPPSDTSRATSSDREGGKNRQRTATNDSEREEGESSSIL
jgi:hypothetical protein